MLYRPDLLADFVAAVPRPMGWLMIILGYSLSLAGLGSLGYFFLGKGADSAKQNFHPFALYISVGWLIAFFYYALRSFICYLTNGCLPFFDGEHLVLAGILLSLNIKGLSWRQVKLCPKTLLYLFVLLFSIFFYGRYHVFGFIGQSSDPTLIAFFTDTIRKFGYISLRTSPLLANLPTYPTGSGLLVMAFTNPLLPTASIVTGIPSLASSLMFFQICEIYLVNRKFDKFWIFAALMLLLLLMRLGAHALDGSLFAMHQEGVLKYSLSFLIVAPIVSDLMNGQRRKIPWSYFQGVLFGVGAALPVVVNPSNLHVSLALSALFFILMLCSTSRRHASFWILSTICSALLVLIVQIQDPFILKIPSLKSVLCASFYKSQVPFCDWTPTDNYFHSLLSVTPNLSTTNQEPWDAYLPEYINSIENLPWHIFEAANSKLILILSVAFLVAYVLSLRNKKSFQDVKPLAKASMILMVLLALGVVMTFPHTYILAKIPGVPIYLLPHYSQRNMFNLLAPVLASLSILFAALLFDLPSSLRFSSPVYRSTFLKIIYRGIPYATILILCSSEAIFREREKFKTFAYDWSRLRNEAEKISSVGRALIPGDVIYGSFSVRQMGEEIWAMPTHMTSLLSLGSRFSVVFGMIPLWQPQGLTPTQYKTQFCDSDACGLLRSSMATVVVTDMGELGLCKFPIQKTLATQKCLEAQGTHAGKSIDVWRIIR